MIGYNPNRLANGLVMADGRGGVKGPDIEALAGLGLDITLNSVTKTAVSSYVFGEGDAPGDSWPCRSDTVNGELSVYGSAAKWEPAIVPGSNGAGLNSGYRIKTGETGTVWQGGVNYPHSLGLLDGVYEFVYTHGITGSNVNIVGARSPVTAGGEVFWYANSTSLQMVWDARETEVGGTPYIVGQYNSAIEAGSTLHVMTCFNRDGALSTDAPLVINGEAKAWAVSQAPNVMAAMDIQCGAYPFNILGSYNASGVFEAPGAVYLHNKWTGAGWLASGATCQSQLVALAQERFDILTNGTGVL
jgi:hypothetical protein